MIGTWFELGRTADESAPRENSTIKKLVTNRQLPLNTLYSCTKAVPLQAWSGPEGSRKLRFPDFVTTAQEGGKVVSLTHRPHLPPRKFS